MSKPFCAEFCRAHPKILNNRKLTDQEWLAYLWMEMYAIGDRIVYDPYDKLKQHLGISSGRAASTLTSIALNAVVAGHRLVNGPITKGYLKLCPVLSDEDRKRKERFVKIYNWLLLTDDLQHFEKRIVGKLLSPSRKHRGGEEVRELSFRELIGSCSIPGRSKPERKRAIKTVLEWLTGKSFVVDLDVGNEGRSGYLRFDFAAMGEWAKEVVERGLK